MVFMNDIWLMDHSDSENYPEYPLPPHRHTLISLCLDRLTKSIRKEGRQGLYLYARIPQTGYGVRHRVPRTTVTPVVEHWLNATWTALSD